jgi:hypothetical protein
MSELKPCPFCGKQIEIGYVGGGWLWRHKLESLYPSCPITYSRKYSTKEELERVWNTRANEKGGSE